MQHEFHTINFVAEAEVRSKAEHPRTEEIMEWLRPILNRWATKFHRRKPAILHAVQSPRTGQLSVAGPFSDHAVHLYEMLPQVFKRETKRK
jgi:hypothetical protein